MNVFTVTYEDQERQKQSKDMSAGGVSGQYARQGCGLEGWAVAHAEGTDRAAAAWFKKARKAYLKLGMPLQCAASGCTNREYTSSLGWRNHIEKHREVAIVPSLESNLLHVHAILAARAAAAEARPLACFVPGCSEPPAADEHALAAHVVAAHASEETKRVSNRRGRPRKDATPAKPSSDSASKPMAAAQAVAASEASPSRGLPLHPTAHAPHPHVALVRTAATAPLVPVDDELIVAECNRLVRKMRAKFGGVVLTHWAIYFQSRNASAPGGIFVQGFLYQGKGCRAKRITVPLTWKTSVISGIRSDGVLTTLSGSLYKLDGPPNEAALLEYGFAPSTAAAFATGFPPNWKALLKTEWARRNAAAALPNSPSRIEPSVCPHAHASAALSPHETGSAQSARVAPIPAPPVAGPGHNSWTDDELAALAEAQRSVPPSIRNYWSVVAAIVGTRSAEECHALVVASPVAPRAGGAPAAAAVEASPIALERLASADSVQKKRMLRKLVAKSNAGHADDAFESTPLRAAMPPVIDLCGESPTVTSRASASAEHAAPTSEKDAFYAELRAAERAASPLSSPSSRKRRSRSTAGDDTDSDETDDETAPSASLLSAMSRPKQKQHDKYVHGVAKRTKLNSGVAGAPPPRTLRPARRVNDPSTQELAKAALAEASAPAAELADDPYYEFSSEDE
ncbi:uncharacterized protein AMSG_03793 [Thecamonas trahens ATCC 50062]|uniref:SANTA domain-containing protein n=1 Tax=Thecamonas trahens ATCC 50062 TaxID=461836 RepID=A0A0L0D4V4_THETB|nr:hypothetical protein AMSG_03793 [Thecamonas trahens ATCC 50062]KNC47359.1 hypothetical protein AMSG_03793 [Thecamonas trahens ATCC 50062]|eukprot:XP_013759697.1 hypothetical protein AMSG_03793 [Thecamonas trahens ATCC 50062]